MLGKNLCFTLTVLLIAAVLTWTAGGCGGGGTGGGGTSVNTGGGSSGTSDEPTPVGNSVCEGCHSGTAANGYTPGDAIDSTTTSPTYYDRDANAGIGTKYVAGMHDSGTASAARSSAPDCETCHGNGSQHYGTGPISNHQPDSSVCGSCHTDLLTSFVSTAHSNPNSTPDQYFYQGGIGTDQATINGLPEYRSDGTTIVTKNEHIEECSGCHNYATPAEDIAAGYNVPNPPNVRCGSCHDTHQPADKSRNDVVTRSSQATSAKGQVSAWLNPNFKPVRVNNDTAGQMFGAKNLNSGTWIRPRLYYQYHQGGDESQTYSGYSQQGASGDPLRLSPERLCAACHTKGQYKYGGYAGSNALTRTHNKDIFAQFYTNHDAGHVVGHSDHEALPWEEFSLLATVGSSHRPNYPFDMGKTDGGIFDGLNPASKNNYACNQCHHGIASIDYQKAVQGGLPNTKPEGQVPNGWGDSSDAHILWGDCTITCITCHEPHGGSSGTTSNIRVPKYLSYNSGYTAGIPNQADNAPSGSTTPNYRGSANKFQDLTDIPSGVGNSIICLFCHQGRESGWTVWNKVRQARSADADGGVGFIYNSADTQIGSFSFLNPHYLPAGALLWSKNAYEFNGKQYTSGNTVHQTENCTGCHMDSAPSDNSKGGHTWIAQIGTCQQCHAGASDFHDITASADYNGSGAVETAFNEIGTLSIIPKKGQAGNPGHGAAVYGNGIGGTGLIGLLNEALWDAGIEYDPASYPYFFQADQAHTSAKAYKAWTPNQLGAAFNLSILYKSGNAEGEQAMYVHNVKFAVQLLIDSLGALPSTFGKDHTKNPGTGNSFNRPSGSRANTDYRNLKP